MEDKNEKSIVYSGDTDFNTEIIELARDADVLILECSFPARNKIAGHLTPKEAAEIAKQSNCRQLILTHFYPPYDELFDEVKKVVPQIYSGKFKLARDFLKLQI